jgi:hypothetical protein
MRLIHSLLVGFSLCLFATARANADCTTYDINNARWIPQDNAISVSLTGTALSTKQPKAQWALIDALDHRTINVRSDGIRYTYNTVTIPAKNLVELNRPYYILATNLKFDDCPKEQEKISPAELKTKRTSTPTFAYSPATNRDDSDFYMAPTVDGASGSKASYTLDAKLQFRKALLGPSFGKGVPYYPAVFFVPGVDAKISSNTNEDADSVLFQVPLEVVSILSPNRFPRLSKFAPSVISQPGYVTESDKKFHDINAIFSEREYIVLHTFSAAWFQITPEPTIGFETGANLKAQSANTYPNSILRANFGMHLGVNLFAQEKAKPLFSIEGDYVRRLLLNPEPTYNTDSNGNYVFVSVGTQPRDYVKVNISYDLTSYVAVSVAYENGRLPPLYTLVSDKYTFGITFKGQLQYIPKSDSE